jgi:endo-1,4-beta-xylanase
MRFHMTASACWVLCGVMLLLALVAPVLAEPPSAKQIADVPSLRGVFGDRFRAGVAIDTRETKGLPAALLLHHFGAVTPENQMKPEEIQPAEGTFTFAAADDIVAFARANDLAVYGHVLVWHSQTADWMFRDADGVPLTNSTAHQKILLDRMETHIQAIAERYRDDVWAFDVVNEVIDETQADGYRRSRWFEVLGPGYIAHAFRFARAAFGPDVALFINDYSSEDPVKREAYYRVVAGLVADGVPIDGVGHQLHIRLTTPISDIDKALTRFSDLGLMQAVTELDVALMASDAEILTQTPRNRLIQQGYFMKDLMAVLDAHADQIVSVSVWGLYDDRSWLRYWPQARPFEAPLLFDDDLNPKPAFWGLADPSQLPHNPRGLTIPEMPAQIDGMIEPGWTTMPPVVLAAAEGVRPATTFQLRWEAGALVLLAEVSDTTIDDADAVHIFVDGFEFHLGRNGTAPDTVTAVATETAHGYRIEALLPAETASASAIFDLRVIDGGTGRRLSWSDQSHSQDQTITRQGILTLRDAIRSVVVRLAETAPTIDGKADPIWDNAGLTTAVRVEGRDDGAIGRFQVMWDEGHIYVLGTVTDADLDGSATSPWERDSIEVFISPGNERAGNYLSDDGQYRIGFDNAISVAGGAEVSKADVQSVATAIDGGYRIEAAIAVSGLAAGRFLGFDLQVNDASGGARVAVHTWQDETGDSYRDTRNWGMATLTGN